MNSNDLFTPCSVGQWELPAKFKTVVNWLYVDTKAGQPTRGWLYLPAGLILSWACPLEQGHEVELWACGPLSLTRPMTEAEQAEWEAGAEPASW